VKLLRLKRSEVSNVVYVHLRPPPLIRDSLLYPVGRALPTPCQCGFIERFCLPCSHHLQRAWDEHLPLPLTLIHSRWWYRGGIESRAGWPLTYGDQARVESTVLTIERTRLEDVVATNDLLT
jgi:hypothetical protein